MTEQVKYLTDNNGNKTDVVLPLEDYLELIEEIDMLKVIAQRKDEPTVSHQEVIDSLENDEL